MMRKPVCESEIILNNKSRVDARVRIRPLVRWEPDGDGDGDGDGDLGGEEGEGDQDAEGWLLIKQQPGNDPDGERDEDVSQQDINPNLTIWQFIENQELTI